MNLMPGAGPKWKHCISYKLNTPIDSTSSKDKKNKRISLIHQNDIHGSKEKALNSIQNIIYKK